MTNINIERAWKDEEYRKTLSSDQIAALPANPAGEIELGEEELDKMAGGMPCQLTSGSCLASKRSSLTCGGCA